MACGSAWARDHIPATAVTRATADNAGSLTPEPPGSSRIAFL